MPGESISNLEPWAVLTRVNNINRYKIIDGAIPKLTTSARESSWIPKSDTVLNNLAKKPSRKSKIAAMIIK